VLLPGQFFRVVGPEIATGVTRSDAT